MSTPTAARIAFIGAGNHSTECLYPNIAHIPEFDLVAVCDLDEAKSARAAKVYGAPEHFTDLGIMLDKVAPDAVCVCGMPDMHYLVGLEVLQRGLPVWMEKPPAWTAVEAAELVAAAQTGATFGMVGFMKRFAPANMVAKDYIENGDFGGLNSFSMIHGSGPYDDIRRMLLFNAIHMLDMGRDFAGNVAEVFAFRSPEGSKVQALTISFRFGNGVVGQLNMNSSVSWVDCFEQAYFSGNGAAILVDASREVHLMAADRQFAHPEGVRLCGWGSRYYVSGNLSGWAAGGHYTRGYHGELEHFAKAVLGQVHPTATLEDGLRALELIEGIMESIETGQPVGL